MRGGEPGQRFALGVLAALEADAEGEGEDDVVLLARVDGAPAALEGRELAPGDAELLRGGAAQHAELAAVELPKPDSDAGEL